MATAWEAVRLSLWVAWPGLLLASTYAVSRATRFYRGLHRSAPGLLVLLTTIGWVATLAATALITTLYMAQDAQQAGPIMLPVFVLWAGSMVTVVWVVQRWGEETTVLDAYYSEVERMERMKSGFINHVAHELKTPITPLRMQVALFRREALGPLTEGQRDVLGQVEGSVDRVSALVEHVVLGSFIQSGRVRLEPHDEDLAAICREVAQAVGRAPVVVEAPGPVHARVDRQHFGHAMQTLCGFLAARQEGREPIVLRLSAPAAVARIDVHHAGPRVDQREFDSLAGDAQQGAIELFNVQGILRLHGGRVEAGDGMLVVHLSAS